MQKMPQNLLSNGIIFKKYKTINEEKLKAEYEATHDSLTNAFNRASFNKKFSKELLRAKRYKTPLCIAILDIDHFKKINDTYGHHIGDVVLKKLVEFIQKNIRENLDNKLFVPSRYLQVKEMPKLGSGNKDFKGAKKL